MGRRKSIRQSDLRAQDNGNGVGKSPGASVPAEVSAEVSGVRHSEGESGEDVAGGSRVAVAAAVVSVGLLRGGAAMGAPEAAGFRQELRQTCMTTI